MEFGRSLHELAPRARWHMSDSWDVSRASSSGSSLAHLIAPDNIPVIDDIVSRIPQDGSFPHAIKAYGDVMHSRGLDPENDVVYYRFMLKLSMIKGAWRDKWQTVKGDLEACHTISSSHSTPALPRFPHRPVQSLHKQETPDDDDDDSLRPSTSTAVSRWDSPAPVRLARQVLDKRIQPPNNPKVRLQQLLKEHTLSVTPSRPSVKGKERQVAPLPPDAPHPLDATRQAQLDTTADVFREGVLLQKAWGAWRAGFHWILVRYNSALNNKSSLNIPPR